MRGCHCGDRRLEAEIPLAAPSGEALHPMVPSRSPPPGVVAVIAIFVGLCLVPAAG